MSNQPTDDENYVPEDYWPDIEPPYKPKPSTPDCIDYLNDLKETLAE